MAGDPTVDITLVLGDSARVAPQEAEPVKVMVLMMISIDSL